MNIRVPHKCKVELLNGLPHSVINTIRNFNSLTIEFSMSICLMNENRILSYIGTQINILVLLLFCTVCRRWRSNCWLNKSGWAKIINYIDIRNAKVTELYIKVCCFLVSRLPWTCQVHLNKPGSLGLSPPVNNADYTGFL